MLESSRAPSHFRSERAKSYRILCGLLIGMHLLGAQLLDGQFRGVHYGVGSEFIFIFFSSTGLSKLVRHVAPCLWLAFSPSLRCRRGGV